VKVGDAVGHYRVVARLGRGGMGEVFLAEHPVVHKQVAVKVLPRAGEQAERRFRTEARALSELRHPGVVQLYDFGATDGGELYFTMERVEGRSLAELLEGLGKLPLPRALRIAADVAEALAAAHACGVVHRDLTPPNVMIVGDHVKVVDFGLAKLLDGGARTAEGGALGTVEYMAPEQCEGRRDIDGRADVYALGCMLHEMLSGAPPFQGEPAEVTRAQRLEPPPPVDGAPRQVAELVAKALAKAPGDRFASMEVMRDALVEVAGGALRATKLEEQRARRPLGAAVVAAGLLALGIAAGAGAWIGLRAARRSGHYPAAQPARHLTVRSKPPGATVVVDGIGYGASPARVTLDDRTGREVEVRVEREGALWRAKIVVEGETEIEAEIEPGNREQETGNK
jgi:serine/threonine-protein kinase